MLVTTLILPTVVFFVPAIFLTVQPVLLTIWEEPPVSLAFSDSTLLMAYLVLHAEMSTQTVLLATIKLSVLNVTSDIMSTAILLVLKDQLVLSTTVELVQSLMDLSAQLAETSSLFPTTELSVLLPLLVQSPIRSLMVQLADVLTDSTITTEPAVSHAHLTVCCALQLLHALSVMEATSFLTELVLVVLQIARFANHNQTAPFVKKDTLWIAITPVFKVQRSTLLVL